MPRFTEWPLSRLYTLAAAFLLTASIYSFVWMYFFTGGVTASPPTLVEQISVGIMRSNPLWFLLVAGVVLFARIREPQAWLLALLYGGAIAAPPLTLFPGESSSGVQIFMVAFRAAFFWNLPALFYAFFATFPAPSPLDRAFPRLKFLLFLPGFYFSLSYVYTVFSRGFETDWRWGWFPTLYFLVPLTLGLISLIGNYLVTPSEEGRRKLHFILWGTLVGVPPTMLMLMVKIVFHVQPPVWLDVIPYLTSYLLPISFGYAMIVHRALNFPTLLRRSVRYFLVQRGFTVLLVLASGGIAIAVSSLLSAYLQLFTDSDMQPGVGTGAVLGILFMWIGNRLHQRASQRIDRIFFRQAYNTRQIMLELTRMMSTATQLQELTILLENRVEQALHPQSLTIYIKARGAHLQPVRGKVPRGVETIPLDLAPLKHMSLTGRSLDLSPAAGNSQTSLAGLESLGAECLVPILSRERNIIGLLALGPRRSEEPYSGEDKELLELVAVQAGVTLESMVLAQEMVERIDTERHAAYEMDVARQVQSKLLPQTLPRMEKLDYDGLCLQSKAVGGDYYDFLGLAPGRLALVLADIAGKGIHAALLMAHLQANLRSQYALAQEDLRQVLLSVNTLFYESTEAHLYATFFIGDFDESTRRLRYANCGHNPPLLLRQDGRDEWLNATAVVIGLFADWDCKIEEVELNPGDTLVVFSDGVTEASNAEEEMFGNERLLEAVRGVRDLPAREMVKKISETVKTFGGTVQGDDLTLLAARVL